MKTSFRSALISLTLTLLTACGSTSPTTDPTIDPATPIEVISVDGTILTVRDNTVDLTSGDVSRVNWLASTTWTSDNDSVVAVEQGSAGITLRAVTAGETVLHGVYTLKPGVRSDLHVVVRPGTVTEVTVTPTAATLTAGATQQLTSSVKGKGSVSSTVTWKSSNPAVATVSAAGLVTAVAAGTATITATSAQDTGKSASAAITVKAAPAPTSTVTGVSITPGSAALTTGGSQTLTATVTGTGAFNPAVTWKSSNPAVATVSSAGQLGAVAAGTTTITATSVQDSSKSASITVTVSAPTPTSSVTGVTVTPSSATLTAGTTQTLTGTVTGTGSFSTAVTWKSSNPAVATVSAAGLVTAVAAGTVTITATSAQDTGKSASATITVTAPAPTSSVTGVTVTPGSATLTVGGTQTLTAAVTGTGTFNPAVTWKSSAPGVASVSASGLVTALAAGTTTITATSVQDSSKSATATLTVQAAPTGGSDPFNITIVFPTTDGLTDSQRQAFQTAARRWEQIIVAGLPDVNGVPVSGQTMTVDDVAIEASGITIDGAGGVLGQAGPYYTRSSGLPLTGIMQFDSADLASMEARGTLVSVIMHEMGHVLGIGTLWSKSIQHNGTSGCTSATQVKYLGTNGLREYQGLGGQVAWVPVEDNYGSGTKCGHWKESVFQTELMTGFASSGTMPLSRITVGALADLGFTVNYAAADPFTLPSATAQGLPTGEPIGETLLAPASTPFPGAK